MKHTKSKFIININIFYIIDHRILINIRAIFLMEGWYQQFDRKRAEQNH